MRSLLIILFILIFISDFAKAQQTFNTLSIKDLGLPSETSSRVIYLNGSNKVKTLNSITDTELGYLDGVTSSIQTQLAARITSTGATDPDIQSVFFGTGASCGSPCTTGTCTICRQIGNKITSVTWNATGQYRLNGIDGTKYTCLGSGVASGTYYAITQDLSLANASYTQIDTAANIGRNSVLCSGIP